VDEFGGSTISPAALGIARMSNVHVYRIPERPLPTPVEQGRDFRDLNETQKRNYKSRLRFIEQITMEMDDWLGGKENDFRSFLDRIELHLAINQGAPHDADLNISSWLMHTSWTFETSARQMYAQLEKELVSELDHPLPGLDPDLTQLNNWLTHQNSALKAALDRFYAAQTFDSAMAHQIAIDILVTNLLSSVVRVRLNPRLLP
jgi:hypothetical protein